MNNDAGLRNAELAILNAPFEEGGWQKALVGIAEQTGSSVAQLLGIGGPLLLPLNVLSGELADRYGHLANPVLHGSCNWRIGSTHRPMAIAFEDHYSAYRAEHCTADYDDAVSDLDIPFGCQAALLLDSNNLLGIALLRSKRDGRCTEEILSDFSVLCRQMERAVRVQFALDGDAGMLMVHGTAGISGATILINRHGSVCATSDAAEAILGKGDPLLRSGSAIRIRDRHEDRCFQQALARLLAADGERGPVLHEARVTRADGRSSRLFAVRLPRCEHGLGFEPNIAVTIKEPD